MQHFDYGQFGGLVGSGQRKNPYKQMVEEGVHRLADQGVEIDFLCRDLAAARESGVVLVCFGGALKEGHLLKGPFFSGERVGEQLKLPLISISDPTLEKCPDLLLSWYMGTPDNPQIPKVIAKHLDSIAEEFDARLVLFGGSGGGFGILNSQQHLYARADSLIWNPQTLISNYILRVVNAYAREACKLEGVLDSSEAAWSFLKRTGVDFDVTGVKISCGNVLYLQNADDNHVQRHMEPLLAKGVWDEIQSGVLYSADRGITVGTALWGAKHAVVPKGTLLMALRALIDGVAPWVIAEQVQAAHPLSSVPSSAFVAPAPS